MKCGIIGLPNVGKSTFFNIITNSNVLSENFPFCTINPNHGFIKIPDYRLFELKKIINPNQVISSGIKIVDIAGLIRGSHKGEGLGNKFLSHIRETNAIIHIIRLFKNEIISHVEGELDPIRDKEIIDTELQLKDLETIQKIMDKISKLSYHEKKNKSIYYLLEKVFSFLKEGKNIRTYPFKKNERENIEFIKLLTIKPVLYICNTNQEENPFIKKLKNIINSQENSKILFLSLKKIKQKEFHKILKNIIQILNLKTFFTVGKKEIKSWNIPNKYTAHEASSVIHTDFKKKFIRAEIIRYNDFIQYQSNSILKKMGKISLVGKNYLVQDGDIIFFRIH